MTSIKNNESMTARANNSHRQLGATISTEVARGNYCTLARHSTATSGGGRSRRQCRRRSSGSSYAGHTRT
jgi:hypothetical protein